MDMMLHGSCICALACMHANIVGLLPAQPCKHTARILHDGLSDPNIARLSSTCYGFNKLKMHICTYLLLRIALPCGSCRPALDGCQPIAHEANCQPTSKPFCKGAFLSVPAI